MARTITVVEFAELAGVTAGTVRRWANDGFPGATKVPSSKNRPMWVFERTTASRFARDVRKVNDTFRVVGRG